MRRTLVLTFVAALLAATPASAQKISWGAFPDYVDPALSYTQGGWAILSQTHLGLVTLSRGEGTAGLTVIPALATALPTISPDGLTYTAQLRPGLRYSNGRRVRAADFEYTIKRVLRLESGGSSFYSANIAGARDYVRRRYRGGISGITARGRTIMIRLTAPNDQFLQILSMPFAGLVPSGTPMRVLTRRPPPGVGPYRISRVNGSRSVTLTRARKLSIPGIPQPKLRTVRHVVSRRPERAGATVDADPSAGGHHAPTLTTYYWFLNATTPPFDNVAVRRAVHTGLDKAALIRVSGGVMRPTCSFVPPELLGTTPACPFTQDLAAAQAQIAAAGAAGAPVTVYGTDEKITRAMTTEFVRQLNAMGFAAKGKILDGEVYFQTIGKDKERPQAGFANWFADFPHPGNFLFLVDPDTNQPTNNQNFSRANDPELKAAIDQGRYADANARAVDQAFVIPWAHRDFQVHDGGLGCVVVHPMYGIDASQLCRR
jgi:peptide/nickel transport system substrate-binding protein